MVRLVSLQRKLRLLRPLVLLGLVTCDADLPTSPSVTPALTVRVLDVGTGDATYIENGASKVIIDGGNDQIRFAELLDSLGVRNTTLDAVILTHTDVDHVLGLRQIFATDRNLEIRYFFDNQDPSTSSSLAALRDSVNGRAARGELIYRDADDPCGDGSLVCTIALDGGAKLHVLRADPTGSGPDDRSTPVKLVGPDSASFTMWLAGDAEFGAMQWFETAQYHVNPGMHVTVLKGQQHGDCKSITARFIELTDPAWVTFSVDSPNPQGRINTQVTDILANEDTPWYRTDENGSITIVAPVDGGYTITPDRGAASMSGLSDRPSASTACNPMP
jgi:competence protein ComEC